MRERPILFSGPMVRALLDGSKTQTRRVMKPQPEFVGGKGDEKDRRYYDTKWGNFQNDEDALTVADLNGMFWNLCPYGQPGDRLWVRESGVISQPYSKEHTGPWCTYLDGSQKFFSNEDYYPARKCPQDKWWKTQKYRLTPSIHMPRWASRITLEVTAVRVERVQDISEEDAKAEGIRKMRGQEAIEKDSFPCAVHAFASLWDSINAKRGFGWDVNPWVWVIEFKRAL